MRFRQVWIFIFLWVSAYGRVDAADPIVIEEQGFSSKGSVKTIPMHPLFEGWKFHPGDNLAWADPDFDDQDWIALDKFSPGMFKKMDWNGLGWFRLNLSVIPELRARDLALVSGWLQGACEIYVDGQLLTTIGQVGDSRETENLVHANITRQPVSFQFDDRENHVIAVRFSNFYVVDSWIEQHDYGFWIALVKGEDAGPLTRYALRDMTVREMISALPLVIALFHFLLFLFYPANRENLDYSLFLICVGCLLFFPIHAGFLINYDGYMVLSFLFGFFLALTPIFCLRFLYRIFDRSLTRFFKIYCVVGGILSLFCWAFSFVYFGLFLVISYPAIIRVVYLGVKNKVPGARLIGAGQLALAIGLVYQILHLTRILESTGTIHPYVWGVLAMVFSMSIYLAINFAKTNEALQLQLDEVKALSERTQEQEQRIREEEIQRRSAEEASHSKSVFLANMSHEIRTPMNAILGYAQLLESDASLGSRHRKAIETIGSSGEHLLGLINDVLDLSKIEAGREQLNTTEFNLNIMVDGLNGMFEMRCRQKGLAWALESNLDGGQVCGDEGKLRQVLINLLGNAVKFTQEGEVKLIVEDRGDDCYYFSVSDTGPGIASDKLGVVFEPFQQEEAGHRQGGTGLGLAISLRQVEMMGGLLGVESRLGRGSRFFFALTLPAGVGATEARAAQSASVQYLADGHSVRALVVDDVRENCDVLGQMLQRVGATVEIAMSGEEALSKVEESMPDIVFMDLRMPGGMDGDETLKRLFEIHGWGVTKVVATTASAFEHQRQAYLDAGFDDYLIKPLQLEDVYTSLANHLGVEFAVGEARLQDDVEETWETVDLPPDLFHALMTSVETQSITGLRMHLNALEQLGVKEQRLTAHLRQLADRYDMVEIKAVLEDIGASKSEQM